MEMLKNTKKWEKAGMATRYYIQNVDRLTKASMFYSEERCNAPYVTKIGKGFLHCSKCYNGEFQDYARANGGDGILL
jgi:hypothetical protein